MSHLSAARLARGETETISAPMDHLIATHLVHGAGDDRHGALLGRSAVDQHRRAGRVLPLAEFRHGHLAHGRIELLDQTVHRHELRLAARINRAWAAGVRRSARGRAAGHARADRAARSALRLRGRDMRAGARRDPARQHC